MTVASEIINNLLFEKEHQVIIAKHGLHGQGLRVFLWVDGSSSYSGHVIGAMGYSVEHARFLIKHKGSSKFWPVVDTQDPDRVIDGPDVFGVAWDDR